MQIVGERPLLRKEHDLRPLFLHEVLRAIPELKQHLPEEAVPHEHATHLGFRIGYMGIGKRRGLYTFDGTTGETSKVPSAPTGKLRLFEGDWEKTVWIYRAGHNGRRDQPLFLIDKPQAGLGASTG